MVRKTIIGFYMAIIGIEGGLGDGKTVYMTRLIHKDIVNNPSLPLLSNYHFFHIDFEYIESEKIKDILKQKKKFFDIAIDEITVWADCRRGMNDLNLLLSYFVLQSRKRGVNMYYTTQDFDMVEGRIINHTDYLVDCYQISKPFYHNGRLICFPEIEDWRHYVVVNRLDRRNPSITEFDLYIKPYYKFYDTDETIMPLFM